MVMPRTFSSRQASVLGVAATALLSVSLALPECARAQESVAQPGIQEQVNIKVQAPSVVVDVIVTDKKGRHVSGLTAQDFRVSEGGAPQKIVAFAPPTEQGTGLRAEAAAETPTARQGVDLTKVRFITLVMDLGDLQPENVKRSADAAVQYLEKYVAPEDYVAVLWIDESLHIAVPFSRDRQQLVEGLRRLGNHVPMGNLTVQARLETQREIDEISKSVYGMGGFLPYDPSRLAEPGSNTVNVRLLDTLRTFLWTQSNLQARAVFVALRAIAQSYTNIPGRKNVVVFSEGFVQAPEGKPLMDAVIDAANRANVAFYVIDAAGLQAGFSAATSVADQTENARIAQLSEEGPMRNYGGYNKFDWIQSMGFYSQYDYLTQVASATGGFLLKNQNDLLRELGTVDRDLREFYTLVYQPTNKTYDGAFRPIKVEPLQSGLRLRYRSGYWAIPAGQEFVLTPAAAQLLAGVESGALKPSLTPKVNSALLLASNGQLAAPVCVSIPTKVLRFDKDPHKEIYRAGVTMVLVGRDNSHGLVSAYQRFLTFQFGKKEWKEFIKHDSVEITGRLAVNRLEPLTVEAILQFADGSVGRGEKQLSIPPSDAKGLQLTGILLSNHIEPAAGAVDPSDPLAGEGFRLVLPSQPSFSPSDKMIAYFMALNLWPDPAAHRAQITLSYALKQGEKVLRSFPAESVEGATGESAMVASKRFDLNQLKPGTYTMEVTVEDQIAHVVAVRDTGFTIEGGA